ncbi:DUF4760 domain-containing protein [Brevundimonas sp. SL130]|uniref:DUF4760 domain-containing protein n=1 Tax=Brevundimonas sp. SL130 TaxID=2995143 RepID=UPI00226D268A|nr:DUF4760 domain-containing protein [Brevundimonas sp. SL130]WAC59459.1 DUF4760 domain-containing protein [Brevundimonas sp. SL130]
MALAMAAGGAIGAIHFILSGQDRLAPPCAVFAAAGLATLGWLIAASNQRTLSRKQHTLNLLMQMRHAEAYNRHHSALSLLSPGATPISAELLALMRDQRQPANEGEKAFRTAAVYILNYWEFVCAALTVGDLDAELMRRTVRQHIVGYHSKFAAFIDAERAAGDRLVYQQLRAIANDWRSPD